MRYLSIILICLFTLLNTSFASQYGSISGYVYDENLKILPQWAEISIKGTKYSTRTDKNGYYKLIGIPTGTYTIKFIMIGYESTIVHNVRIEADSDTELPVCVFSASLADPPEYPSDFDGSDAIITPYNPSQKNIDLEKTGKVDIKEKTKCSKLDMIEIYHLIKDGKHLNNPINQNIVGEYIAYNPKDRIVFQIVNGQLNRQNIYSNSKGRLQPLLNTGNNRFIYFGEEITFKNDSAIVQKSYSYGRSLKKTYKKIK